MNNIQNYGITNYQIKNNTILFRANTKIGNAVQKATSKPVACIIMHESL